VRADVAAISQRLRDRDLCAPVRNRSHYANWISGSAADDQLTLALRSLLRRKETCNSTPTSHRMTTQDSITIRELAENRMEKEFPYGFTNGFPPPKHSSRSERKKMRDPKTQICTRAKTWKVRERPHLVRLSAAQESVGSLPHFPKAACPRYKANQTPCTATCMTAVKTKGEKTLTFIATRITQASGLTCCKEEAFAKGDTAWNREESNNYTLHFFNG
jgi:hypothetical protein